MPRRLTSSMKPSAGCAKLSEIEFDAENHVYKMDGVVRPSVTQILEPLNKLEGVPRHVLDAASEFGSHAHQAVDLFNKCLLDEPSLDPHLKPYLDGWKAFLRDVKGIVMESEKVVYHTGLKYCGTLDATVLIEGFRGRTREYLVDLKTGLVPRSVGAQCAAYERALRRMRHGNDDRQAVHGVKLPRRCVQLLGDGKYKLIALDRDDVDWNLFVSCTNIWGHLNEKS
jgi:hypothetical protein